MRRPPAGVAQSEIDVGLAEVDRQQLGVTVGEMQEACIAEALDAVVETRARGKVERGGRVDRQARRGRGGDRVQELAAIHAVAAAVAIC